MLPRSLFPCGQQPSFARGCLLSAAAYTLASEVEGSITTAGGREKEPSQVSMWYAEALDHAATELKQGISPGKSFLLPCTALICPALLM